MKTFSTTILYALGIAIEHEDDPKVREDMEAVESQLTAAKQISLLSKTEVDALDYGLPEAISNAEFEGDYAVAAVLRGIHERLEQE